MNFTTVTNQVRSIFSIATTKANKLIDKGIYNAGQSGSTPNKIVSLALSSAAAYAVGVNPVYIAFVVVYSTLFVVCTAPRWILETAIALNLLIISATTLPQGSVTALVILLLGKLTLELICCIYDKLTQLWASLTKDKKHSYYFIWVMFTWILVFMAQPNPFIQGFTQGLAQGLSGN
jgi:hypothetical protein